MVPASISNWLEQVSHPSIMIPRTLILTECSPRTPALETYLADRLISQRLPIQVAKDMCQLLGWGSVKNRLVASTIQVRHGDFGELLAAEVLETFAGLKIPIHKVRCQLHASQTLPGADVVALELVGDEVTALHFAEAKYRASADTSAASAAHDQLVTWYSQEFDQIVMFLGSWLAESDPALYSSLFAYLSDPRARSDSFHIVLIWEASVWTDTVVTNLPDSPALLSPLEVRAVQISDVNQLADRVFATVAARVGAP